MWRRWLVAAAWVGAASVRAATPIAPDTYLVAGAAMPGVQPDGNSVLIETQQGLIVFDTGRHAAHTQQILDFADAAGLRVNAIVNSHWHLDHIGGNAMLREAYPDVQIYASGALTDALGGFLAHYREQLADAVAHSDDANARASMQTEIALIDAGPALAPTYVVRASGLRTIAGRDLDLHLERAAVTAGDLWLYDPKTRVLLAGDLVTLPVPFLDTACPRALAGESSPLESHALPPARARTRRAHGAQAITIAIGPPSTACSLALPAHNPRKHVSTAGYTTPTPCCRPPIATTRAP